MQKNKGLLLMNIGSPRSYEVADVKKYLSAFLMDEDVINLPFLLRWPLVNLIIVPKRAPFSAENYKKVWMPEGSPIVVYTKRMSESLRKHLPDFSIKMGLQYSMPSVLDSLKDFQAEGVQEIYLAPMFPQYADATTKGTIKAVQKALKMLNYSPTLKEIKPFFDHHSFMKTSSEIALETLKNKTVDHYVFSFHGLPESHILKDKTCSLSEECCSMPRACLKNCYRAQCFMTAKLMTQEMGISKDQYTVCFQSRLGRAEWLKPSTEDTIKKLAQDGVKSIAVLCPSFVSDCIETLEEIGIGGQEIFHEHGGKDFYLVPCVNDDPRFVQGFSEIIRDLEQGPSSL